MDYEKKYNEILAWAKKYKARLNGVPIEDIFPELRESEDERIRKWLVDYFSSIKETVWIHRDISCEQILEWLEKQKELTATMNGEPIPTENHSVDVPLAEWSEEDETRLTNTLIMPKEYAIHHYSKEDVEKSVDWLENRVKSIRPQPKPAWSEEDEDMLNSCISSIEEAKENRYAYKETDGDTSYDHEIAWLKSLRPSWKPNEEQMDALQHAIDACESEWDYQDDELRSLLNDIKKL